MFLSDHLLFLEILNLNLPFAVCNRYFWDISLKIYRLPNFNMLLQFVRTKFFKSKLFSCLPESSSRGQLMQKAYYNWTVEVHKNQSSLLPPSLLLFKCSIPIPVSGVKKKKSDWNNAWPKLYEQRLLRTRADTPLKDSFFFFFLLLGNKNSSPFYCWLILSVC